MWPFPGLQSIFFPSPYRECQRCRGTFSYDNLDSLGSSFPVAILIGLMCAYVWVRIRPFVSDDHPDERPDSIIQDLTEVKAFLSNLQDQVSELLGSKTTTATAANGERMSKEGEDILLSKSSGRNGMSKGRFTSEAILGTMTIGTHVAKDTVASLAQRLHVMGNGGYVYEVMESSSCVLLQSRLPITSNLLYQAFEVAKQGIALDPQCTLQLGSWGTIMLSEGDVKCLKLRDGDVPVLLDSTLEGGHELRVEGLFLEGVQMRATTADQTVVLRNISLVKDAVARQMDVLFVKEPIGLIKGSLIYASKIVQFKGVAVVVRSGLTLIGFQPKPQHSNHNGMYLLALLSFIITLLPRQIWWPILGHVGTLFLPVFQIAAVVIGWKIGQYIMLGEWPNDNNKKYETKFDKKQSLWGSSDDIFRLTSPWDSAVRMEINELGKQLVQKLEKQPSTSNVGIYAQQADFRTEFWQKGLAEMDQAIETQPQNATPFRIRGCIKGLAGDYDGALKDLDNALQLRKDDVLALLSRGIFKFLTGDYEGALPDLNQGIKHDPAQPTEVIKLRDTISKILADREELEKLRVQNPQLKAELDALKAELDAVQKKAAADLEAMRLKGEADLEAMRLKGESDLEALRLKDEAELEALRVKSKEEFEALQLKSKEELEALQLKSKEELEALQLKSKEELEALQLKSKEELEAMRLKGEADLEALRLKLEAELEAMRLKAEKLQEDLSKAVEILKKIPQIQTMELQYNNLCCEKCVRDIKSALFKFPGIESVVEDMYNNRVSVTGCLVPSFVLAVCRKTSPTKVISVISPPMDPLAAPAAASEPVPESIPTATHEHDSESREMSEPTNKPVPESTTVSKPEDAPPSAPAESNPEVEANPAPTQSTPEVPAAPVAAESNPEVPAAPAPVESEPEVPAAPADAEANPEVPAAPASAEANPEVPAPPPPAEANPEVPAPPPPAESKPEDLAPPPPAESTPEDPAAPAPAESNPEVPTEPAPAESNPEVPAQPDSDPAPEPELIPEPKPEPEPVPAPAESNPDVPASPPPAESKPEDPAAPPRAESKPEDPAQPDSDPAPEPEIIPEPKPGPEPEPELIPEPKPEPEPEPKQDPSNPESKDTPEPQT
ncbi:unnamed protein product [Sphagnum jensenii]|uniref:HMA domain-containing protein n=1 Tax=Sphagnum jensenii TaxID=128206 RepID=A0ABP1BNV3_9BRYO